MFKKSYWNEAAKSFTDIKVIAVAAVIVALRVAVKMFSIPLAVDLKLTFDCYINSLGAFIYGPLMALLVGAVSDTLGCIIFPSGPYFFPFIFVEMLSGFIFGLFLWRRKLNITNVILSKFTVNFVCNIILTSVVMKWYFKVFDFGAYSVINLVRIVKNIVLFGVEGILITLVLTAVVPALAKSGLVKGDVKPEKLSAGHIVLIVLLILLSAALVLFYIFFLKDYVSAHNIKLF